MPRMRPLPQRDADRVRPRRRPRPCGAGRRTARRHGGPQGIAVRRPGRAPAAPGGRRRGAGLDPAHLYITNAVKHFKFTSTGPGKRRLHRTPDQAEIRACRPWLVAEFAHLRPQAIVVLGATAAKALLGPDFRVTRSRGQVLPWPASAEVPEEFPDHDGAFLVATIHPSAVLRADNQEIAYRGLVADLRVVVAQLTQR